MEPKRKRFKCQVSNVDGVRTKIFTWPLSSKEKGLFKNGGWFEWKYSVVQNCYKIIETADIGERKYYKSLRDEPDSLGIITRIA